MIPSQSSNRHSTAAVQSTAGQQRPPAHTVSTQAPSSQTSSGAHAVVGQSGG
jgi:hypothetical protein